MPHTLSAANNRRRPSASSGPFSARPRNTTLGIAVATERMCSAEKIAESTVRSLFEGDRIAAPDRAGRQDERVHAGARQLAETARLDPVVLGHRTQDAWISRQIALRERRH